MASIALRVPTVDGGNATIVGGHCYILFDERPLTVRDLIAEKIRAEHRKLRVNGNDREHSLHALLGIREVGRDTVDEWLHISRAYGRFQSGALQVVIDGHPATSLDQLVRLTRRTGIAFVVAAPAPVLVDEFQTVVEA